MYLKLKETDVKTFELDYADENSIEAVAREIGDVPLNILINNAGKYHVIFESHRRSC
jgi:short-subunit dehydrogenase